MVNGVVAGVTIDVMCFKSFSKLFFWVGGGKAGGWREGHKMTGVKGYVWQEGPLNRRESRRKQEKRAKP